jgi:peptide/nickel transport system ATP-binding protein
MSRPTCRVSGLRVELTRDGTEVVDGISFELHPGEVLALVGESGSGKTTVGTALLAHHRRGARAAGGSVELDEVDLLAARADVVRKIRGAAVAYIPQDPAASLNPALRIGLQIREVLDAHGFGTPDERRQRVREVLAEVALPTDDAFARRFPHQLSGGQLQRVAIAMAFALRPRVLVLDEPTTGLDVTTQAHVLATVRELCGAHRVAAVYVTHDLAVVGELADRNAVLYGGQIVELGPREEVFAAPSHPYTRALLAAIPSVTERRVLTGIPGRAPAPGNRPSGCRFHDRCAYALPECAAVEPPLVPVEAATTSVKLSPEPVNSQVLSRCLRAAHVRAQAAPVAVADLVRAASTETVLGVAGLCAAYGQATVLHGIDLRVGRNECVALVGQSGSGKSTLARCIAGLHSDWPGTVTYAGATVPPAVRRRRREVRKAIQYVFQNPYLSLNPRRTVGAAIRRPLEVFGLARGRAADAEVLRLLDQVSLPASVVDLLPDRLSGGERQRVAIARALACEPELLICDEVTSALDVSVQASIVALLARIRQERGLSMLFVTHNLALVRSIAAHTVVLHEGRVVEEGETDQVLEHPTADYTATLLRDTPRLATP